MDMLLTHSDMSVCGTVTWRNVRRGLWGWGVAIGSCVCVCAQSSQGHRLALLPEIICSIISSNAHCQIYTTAMGYSMSVTAGDVLDNQEIGW